MHKPNAVKNGMAHIRQLKRGLSTPGKHELLKPLERYLAGLGQLVDRVDAMKQEGRFQ